MNTDKLFKVSSEWANKALIDKTAAAIFLQLYLDKN